MNIRWRVTYCTQEEKEMQFPIASRYQFPHKLIRASSEEKAKEIFKTRYPELVPLSAYKY